MFGRIAHTTLLRWAARYAEEFEKRWRPAGSGRLIWAFIAYLLSEPECPFGSAGASVSDLLLLSRDL
jgi:hypothetical protein